MSYSKNLPDTDELRQLAQQRFQNQQEQLSGKWTQEQAEQLLAQLTVHQFELELQNEQIGQARAQLEAALHQCNDLYNFAPAGFINLDDSGNISKLNLHAAQLMGDERTQLLGRHFFLIFPEDERAALGALVSQVQIAGEVAGGEFSLLKDTGLCTHVELNMTQLVDGQGLQVVMQDISEKIRQRAQARLREERWQFAMNVTGDGLWDWDLSHGNMAFWPPEIKLFGYTEGEFQPTLESWMARIHEEDKPRVVADLQANISGTQTRFVNEHRVQIKGGDWKWVLSRGAVVERDAQGRALRMIGTHIDLTLRKQLEEALREANQFQQAVFDALSPHMAVIDRQGFILQTNAAWKTFGVDNGFSPPSRNEATNYLTVLRQASSNGKASGSAAASLAGIELVISGKQAQFQLEYACHSPTRQSWFIMRAVPVRDQQGRVVISHEDITDIKEAELANLKLANFDALTEALSRRHFFSIAEQEVARSIRYKLPLMVLMLDLDHFKAINDRHGHAAGDAVLKGFVQTVSSVLRESDVIGRIGGEEFSVLLPNTTQEGGRALAQRIIENVRANPVVEQGCKIDYTISVGASCLRDQTSFNELLKLADAALYQAKHSGRNRLEIDSLKLLAGS